MTGDIDFFKNLEIYNNFEASFRNRLYVINAREYITFDVGSDLGYVHSQWIRMLKRIKNDYRDFETQIRDNGTFSEILGELCNGLSRFDTVVVNRHSTGRGDHISDAQRQWIDFIAKFHSEFFAAGGF